jgi:bacterioferritin
MKDEEGHIDFLETQLDLVKDLGVQLYSQKHVGSIEADHPPESK